MTISRDEAREALAEIGDARGRIDRMHGYADAAPFLILWGLIWLVANSVTDLAPEHAGLAWGVGIVAGTLISAALGVANVRRWNARVQSPDRWSKGVNLRIGLSWLVTVAFLVSIAVIIEPLDPRQTNAAISAFWAFLYMGAGVWLGWRLAAIGLVTAVAIMSAYLMLDQHYFLFMGVVAGGSLILGGLWLRRV